MNTKPFFASKTIWLNLLAGILPILDSVTGTGILKNNPQALLWFGVVVAILNVILRTFSSATPIVPPDTTGGPRAYLLLVVVGLAFTTRAVASTRLESFAPKLAGQAATDPPKSPWSGSVFLTRHDTFIVVAHEIGSSPKLFGLKNVTVHLQAFAGYGYHSQTAIAGGEATLQIGISAADTLTFGPGFGSGVHGNKPFVNVGFGLGITHRF